MTRAMLVSLLRGLFVVIIVGAGSDALANVRRYVDDDAPPGGDGRSWETPYRFLQDALLDPEGVDIVYLAQGVYWPDRDSADPDGTGDRAATFMIDSVDVKGGYAGVMAKDPADRDTTMYRTVLSGDLAGDDGLPGGARDDNAYHVVITDATGVRHSACSGVTIRGGTTDGECCESEYFGGGVLHRTGLLVLVDCVIEDNEAPSGGGVGHPGEGSIYIVDCVVTNNRASAYGGGFYTNSHDYSVSSSVFIGNSANHGGAVKGEGGVIRHCRFLGNSAGNTGGAISGDPDIVNSIFSGNTTEHGGALYGHGDIDRCVFSHNHATHRGGALYTPWPQSIRNTILWGNTAPHGPQIYGMEEVTMNYSCLEDQIDAVGGFGNHELDPRFVDALGADGIAGTIDDDLQLLPDSPCVNAGDPGATFYGDVDLDGVARVQACRLDMGPYESAGYRDDCNGNGIGDACDLFQGGDDDCNGNGIPDGCDIADGVSEDCNANGTPDECETLVTFERIMAPLPPVETTFTLMSVPEVVGDVSIAIQASADLGSTNEYIKVRFDGIDVGSVFVLDASDCADPADEATLTVPLEVFNPRVSGGRSVEIELRPQSSVDVGACPSSWMAMQVRGLVRVGPNDADGDGVPDDCACPADVSGDGTVGIADMQIVLATWGPAAGDGLGDVDDDGVVALADLLTVMANWGVCP